jgi:hypothetical protein
MSDQTILAQQGLQTAPEYEGTAVATNLVVPPLRSTERLANFSEDVFDLSPETHLSRFLKVMIGDAGVGRLSKVSLLSRLGHSIYGSHFFDLDRFYGVIFGAQRRVAEIIDGNPYEEPKSEDEWGVVAVQDDSYRSRMEQLARAITYGASPTGLELAAEALLNVDCDIYEGYIEADTAFQTYGDLQADTYGTLESFTYGELEGTTEQTVGTLSRSEFTVVPHRSITVEEHYDLTRVLSVLKPAGTLLKIADGPLAITDVMIRGAEADSTYWRIEQSTASGGALVPKVRPPFTAYQGEAFTHLHVITGVSSYALNPDDSVEKFNIYGAVQLFRGPLAIFTPDLAVASLEQVMAGRLVSDGVLVKNPYAGITRGKPIPVFVTPTYADIANEYRIDVAKPQDPVRRLLSDGYSVLEPGQWITPIAFRTRQHFWATPERAQNDPLREVVEMRLKVSKLTNYVSLELARFPHDCEVQAWDDGLSEWVTLREISVTESYPQRIATGRVVTDTHPQHALSGHWFKVSIRTSAIQASRFRLVLKRTSHGIGPKDDRGRPIPYSLAVRNWDVGYRIFSREDLPEPDETLSGAFATTLDAQGKTVYLSVAEQPASNVLDLYANTIWRSEPQPTNRAVVNFYLDVRDHEGMPQVIDGFDLEPARSGPHLNLYWSEETEIGFYEAADTPVDTEVGGTVDTTSRGIRFSNVDESWVRIPNSELHFHPYQSWWIGFWLQPKYALTANGTTRTLLKAGDLELTIGVDATTNRTQFMASSADASSTSDINFSADANVYVMAWFNDETGTLGTATMVGTTQYQDDVLASPDGFMHPDEVYIGGAPGEVGSNVIVRGFFIKTGMVLDDIETMAANFPDYLLKSKPGVATKDYTHNSILRYHPSFLSAGQFVFRGGVANLFDSMTWHPIERDYKLVKGRLNVPPTRAHYWKFEFTNLVPEPIESFVPVRRTVRFFPPTISNIPEIPSKPISSSWHGLKAAVGVAANAQFADTPLNLDDFTPPSKLPSPTAVVYAPDVQQTYTMRKASWMFGFQPWQVGSRSPRFHEVGQHIYATYEIIDQAKIGYFVGLKAITAFRHDPNAAVDTKVYREHFDDDAMIASSTFHQDLGRIYSGPDIMTTATSKVYGAAHGIKSLQFAAMQSDPVQIVPDDDFRDPTLSTSRFDNTYVWHAYGDGQIEYVPSEYAVTVSRNVGAVGQGASNVGVSHHLADRPLHPVFDYDSDAVGTTPVSQASGGIESGLLATSAEGMLNAAVRVTGITSTTNPLILQIVSTDGTVLAEQEQYLGAGETAEWTVAYQLGSVERGGYQVYQRRGLLERPLHPEQPTTPSATTGETQIVAPDEIVRVRLIQEGASTDAWKIDRLSLFDDSIVWEFSNDGGDTWGAALGNINGNPNGIFTFENPTGTALCWRVTAYRPGREITSLQIRPWYKGRFGSLAPVPNRGPNVSSFDHDPPIEADPEFQPKASTVPRWWWQATRGVAQGLANLPAEGQPIVDNPFAAFYGRAGTDTVAVPTDVGTALVVSGRIGSDTVPQPVDVPTVHGTYKRTGTDTVAEPVVDTYVSLIHEDAMLTPPMHPL